MAAISTQQNSLELLLWSQPVNNVGFRCRQFPQLNLLLLPHRLPLPSYSLSIRRCFHLPSPPLPPLLRRRLLPLCSPMSSLNSDHNPPAAAATAAAKTVRVVVKGRVQGVFYRNWTIENAIELGLNGWVRNRRDGSVEALFSGKPEKVEEMEQRCRRGPPHAMVTGLQVFPSTDDPGTSFEHDENSVLDSNLPEDVKKGHFVVHTAENGKSRRSIVELSYLAHPGFLKLLDQAEQEFGFKQTGILAIPCRYSDLKSVLESKK